MAGQAIISGLPRAEIWPALPLTEWSATRDTLHLWLQMVGKLRLALSPRVNHWWEVPLYPSPRGLATSAVPYQLGIFEAEFDFVDHVLRFTTSRSETRTVALAPRSVADFYREFKATLAALRSHLDFTDAAGATRIYQFYAPRFSAIPRPSLTGLQKVLDSFRAAYPAAASMRPEDVYQSAFLDELERRGLFAELYRPAGDVPVSFAQSVGIQP